MGHISFILEGRECLLVPLSLLWNPVQVAFLLVTTHVRPEIDVFSLGDILIHWQLGEIGSLLGTSKSYFVF
jgi:hypothetical protein